MQICCFLYYRVMLRWKNEMGCHSFALSFDAPPLFILINIQCIVYISICVICIAIVFTPGIYVGKQYADMMMMGKRCMCRPVDTVYAIIITLGAWGTNTLVQTRHCLHTVYNAICTTTP